MQLQPALDLVEAHVCETGRRSSNDDCFFVDRSSGIYLVCDGAGGRMGGRTAAEIVCQTVRDRARQLAASLGQTFDAGAQHLVARVLLESHQRILDAQSRDPALSSMTTTAALVVHRGARALVSHVGDSRVYLYREADLRQLTRDHSLENYMKDHPEFRPRSQRPGKTLVRALGLRTSNLVVDQRELGLEADDLLLICTDGLTDSIPSWTLREILSARCCCTVDELAGNLVRAALTHGSMDNVTAMVMQAGIGGGPGLRTEVFDFETASGAHRPRLVLGWIAFVEGPRSGEVMPIEALAVVGAEPGCHVVVDDGYVSSRHIEIHRTEHGFVLRDMGSTNGTFINNIRLPPRHESALVDGDLVRVGKSEMIFKSALVEV